MSVIDSEWRDLMEDWQSAAPEEPAPAALSDEVRHRIRRQVRLYSYGLILLTVCEITGALAFLAILLRRVLKDPEPFRIAGLLGAALFFAASLAFSFWNRRGTWWPAAESTSTFLDLSLERCRRKLRTLRLLPWLLAAELAFILPWATWALLSKPDTRPADWLLAYGFAFFASAALLGWGAWYKKKTLREKVEWEELRKSLGG